MIGAKQYKVPDFPVDYAAIIARAKLFRKALQAQGKVSEELSKLIFSRDPKLSETDFLFIFGFSLLESCCSQKKMPIFISKVIWNGLKDLTKDPSFMIDEDLQKYIVSKFDRLRIPLMHSIYKNLKLASLLSKAYFSKMAQNLIFEEKLEEAAIVIVKFGLGDQFDLVGLAIDMVHGKKNCKKLLDMEPSIRETVIRKLTTQTTAKTAADLVKYYKLDP